MVPRVRRCPPPRCRMERIGGECDPASSAPRKTGGLPLVKYPCIHMFLTQVLARQSRPSDRWLNGFLRRIMHPYSRGITTVPPPGRTSSVPSARCHRYSEQFDHLDKTKDLSASPGKDEPRSASPGNGGSRAEGSLSPAKQTCPARRVTYHAYHAYHAHISSNAKPLTTHTTHITHIFSPTRSPLPRIPPISRTYFPRREAPYHA
jgi:hypothetical protein